MPRSGALSQASNLPDYRDQSFQQTGRFVVREIQGWFKMVEAKPMRFHKLLLTVISQDIGNYMPSGLQVFCQIEGLKQM
jgi:hypothetical protein